MRAAAEDLPGMLRLLNRELGDPLYSEEGLARDLEDPEAGLFVAGVAAGAAGAAAGAAIARLLVPGDIGYYERFGEAARRAFAAGMVGSLEALAVAPEARRRGLGSALVREADAWLQAAGAAAVVVVGWDSGRPGSSLPMLRRLGYEESERVDEFYAEESERGGWTCPVDGRPCRCGAVLFVKFLGG